MDDFSVPPPNQFFGHDGTLRRRQDTETYLYRWFDLGDREAIRSEPYLRTQAHPHAFTETEEGRATSSSIGMR